MKTVKEYKKLNNYDFWNEHVKHVVDNSIMLAKKYNADIEIVELGALLHDISLSSNYGPREEHHIYGAEIADKLLNKYKYPKERIEMVKKCILNHRNNDTKKTTIEEVCVADADIISHFNNIPMIFSKAYLILKLSHAEGVKYVKEALEKDYNELSKDTKALLKDRYEEIIRVIFTNDVI
jgi:uncharacterized protein